MKTGSLIGGTRSKVGKQPLALNWKLQRWIQPKLKQHPHIRSLFKSIHDSSNRLHFNIACRVPAIVRPSPRQLTIAITAHCNFRCIGCKYGRDFMSGEKLSLQEIQAILQDAKAAGIGKIRFYGGEPLLHKQLSDMVQSATDLGLEAYITTNGSLLDKYIDKLYKAGLRWASIAYYGDGEQWADYTQLPASTWRIEDNLKFIRERYSEKQLALQLNLVVVRPLATLELLEETWRLANTYGLVLHVDFFGYSAPPFFTKGPAGELVFRPEDKPGIKLFTKRLLEMHANKPERFAHSRQFLRSIPDWIFNCGEMKVPCDAYQLLWIGADGSVQLCDTAFPLGNIWQKPLREILFGEKHTKAGQNALRLNCPNCSCKAEERIRKHGPSWRKYSQENSL